MKKKMLSIVLFGLVLLVSPLLQAQAANKVYKIRFTAYWPPAHHLIKTAELLAKNVQARTNGRLVVEVYPSAQLYPNNAKTPI
jgi:TRAP-type C4-dicarboxylate transport system substrate-binding protein